MSHPSHGAIPRYESPQYRADCEAGADGPKVPSSGKPRRFESSADSTTAGIWTFRIRGGSVTVGVEGPAVESPDPPDPWESGGVTRRPAGRAEPSQLESTNTCTSGKGPPLPSSPLCFLFKCRSRAASSS
ncbi:hypothetical protein ACEPAH_4619 [Sanghuangporus vaninii]